MVETYTLRNHRVKALTLQSTIVNLKALRVSCDSFEGGATQNPKTPNPQNPFNDFDLISMDCAIFYLYKYKYYKSVIAL